MADIVKREVKNYSPNRLDNYMEDADWHHPEVQRTRNQLTNLFNEIWEHGAYSPDIPVLSKMEEHYVFVYGTLKENFRNHRLLADQKFVGAGSTYNTFNMLVTKNTAAPYPIVFNDGRPNTMGAIYGEVYKVDVPTLRALDYLESNGTMYKRHITPIVVPFRDGPNKKLYAWMYKGKRNFWATREANLAQVDPFISHKAFEKENAGRYYLFTKALENGLKNT